MLLKLIAAIIILGGGFMGYKNNTLPDYLGVVDGKFSPVPSSPNAVSSQSDDPEKLVDPFPFTELDKAKQAVYSVLEKMGGNNIVTDENVYMHIVFTTPTMQYKDDVELYFDTTSQRIEYRSQSRVGYSDRGLNRERYYTFSKLYFASE
ncbi:DUF1499 domain-containing protein [Vibrio hannami]|uniref:DUF1499 domain-containing protein n=1 Tax=Vibrio hannami TaxID=2717094 RepID=UPI00241028B1|nr:DUF1499 domain-containing protein [Vibrio hannami]MDG3085487.1 DUF1499 domain-containing protein [Vibrio hannami]